MSLSAWLAGASARLQTVWIPAVLVSGAAVVSVLLCSQRPAVIVPDNNASDDRNGPENGGSTGLLDVEREVRSVLAGLTGFAATRLVRFELAVQPDLAVRADAVSFRDALAGLVTHAAAQAPSGRVLVTGMRRGGRVQIAVADDGIGTDRLVQAGDLRSAERIIALQGGTLEIANQPGEGTTLLARWPDIAGRAHQPAPVTRSENPVQTAVPAASRQNVFNN